MDNFIKILKSPPSIFILLFALFCALLYIKLSATDNMHKKAADDLIETVMTNWLNKDYVFNYDLWEDKYKTPPVHAISDYKIENKIFYERLNNEFADYDIVLTFPSDSFLPSGQNWKAILIRTPDGWRVRDFTLMKDKT